MAVQVESVEALMSGEELEKGDKSQVESRKEESFLESLRYLSWPLGVEDDADLEAGEYYCGEWLCQEPLLQRFAER